MQTPQPAGQPTWPGQSGRDELVLAVVQPAHRAVLRLRVGRLRDASSAARAVEYQGRHELRRRRHREPVVPVPGAPRRSDPARPDQQLDRSGRPRRGASRSIPATGRAKWKFTDDRRHRQRHPDDGVGRAVHRRTRRLSSRRSTRAPARCCGRRSLGAAINSGPISYRVGTRQYVSVVSGLSLFVFAAGRIGRGNDLASQVPRHNGGSGSRWRNRALAVRHRRARRAGAAGRSSGSADPRPIWCSSTDASTRWTRETPSRAR